MPTERIKVAGMRGDGDGLRVRHALGEVWGIRETQVNASNGEVTFTYDEKAASVDDFLAAIRMSGFEIVGGAPPEG